jgi:hypothetical protein
MATQPAPDDSGDLRAVIDAIAAAVVQRFAAAEQALIREVAAYARAGLAAPVGSAARLDMLRRMRAVADRLSLQLCAQASQMAAQVTDTAHRRGAEAAIRRLTHLTTSHPDLLRILTAPQPEPVTSHALASVTQIQMDLASRLWDASTRMTRFADDAYRAAIARAATTEVLTGMSPAAAQRMAWDELTSKGVTGFVDTRGRQWTLASYVEMATRTAVQRAYNTAHQDRMTSAGIHYFTVAPHAHPCPLCEPWEGAVLSDVHAAGETTTLSAVKDVPVTFTIAGTVDEARAAGLFHPNCSHTLVAFLPGVTKPIARPSWTKADQAAYDAAQHLRALERQVRAYKLQAEGALTPLEQRRAMAKARAVQARIREHVEAHGLVRRRRREQLNLGHQ